MSNSQNLQKEIESNMKERGRIILDAWNVTNRAFKDSREELKKKYDEHSYNSFKVN